jgi:hypothetical protein
VILTTPTDEFDFLFEPEKVSQFLLALKASGRTRVDKSTIWSAFTATYVDLPQGPDRRHCLMKLLRELQESEEVRLPVSHGKRWDRNSSVPTPTSIEVRHDRQRQSMVWQDYPWHPQLQWVLDRNHLSDRQFDFLKNVQRGLVAGWFATLAPLKYRSLQLTGDEKQLLSLCKTQLFGAGRLTLSMLGCDPEILPMVVERVSGGSDLLIFENAAPFMLARKVLRDISDCPIGRIAYGSGNQVSRSIEYLQLLGSPANRVVYVGDLDLRGIYIAAKLHRHCEASGLPRVHPATVLHRQMLASAERLGAPQGWPDRARPTSASGDWIFRFLELEVRQPIRAVVESQHRIPEEALDESDLRACLENW